MTTNKDYIAVLKQMRDEKQDVIAFHYGDRGEGAPKELIVEIEALTAAIEALEANRWRVTTEEQPDRNPNLAYSTVPCLVTRKGWVEILVFNHEEGVWDDAEGDDYCSGIEDTYWIPLPAAYRPFEGEK